MTKYPKTIAAVQKHDRSLWEIGDALLDETDKGDPHHELAEIAIEIESVNIEGFSAGYLAKIRAAAENFPRSRRSASISWRAHVNAGSSEMLQAIVAASGSKPVTADRVKATRKTIEEHQARKHKEKHPGKPLPKRGKSKPPSQKESVGLRLMAEVAEWANELGVALKKIDGVRKGLTEAKRAKIEPEEADFLVSQALKVLDQAKQLAEWIKPLQSKHGHLSVVGE